MSRSKKNTQDVFHRQEFYDLMLKKNNGTATLKDLTQLDRLINADPALRELILKKVNELPDAAKQNKKSKSLWQKARSFFSRLLSAKNNRVPSSINRNH